MNIEKWVTIASFVLLVLLGLCSWRITPRLAAIGEQRREDMQPLTGKREMDGSPVDIAAYLAQGDNVFLWKGQAPIGPPPLPNPDPSSNVTYVEPEPVPVPTPSSDPPPEPPPPPRPKYKLPVRYVGTVKVQEGKELRHAIFEDTSSGEYVRLREGDAYRDIILDEVKVNSVRLRNKKDKIFILPHERGDR
jgi:hypothetical protein